METTLNPFYILDDMPHFMKAVLLWLQGQPILTSLLLMMAIDMAAGIAVAIMRKKLSSTISWRGACKKVIMLLLVGVAALLEPFAGGLPLTKMVAAFFLYNESLSVLENAAEAGVPLPRALVDTLAKLRDDGHKDIGGGTKPPSAHVHIETTAPTKIDVDPSPKP